MIYRNQRWTQQPQTRVQVDWGSSLTRGLVNVLLPNTLYHRDLVRGGVDTAQYRAPLGVGSKGLALSNTNSGNPWSTLITVPGVAGGYSALTTFCLYEQPDTTTFGAAFGAGLDTTYYQGFTKNADGTVTFGPATNSGGLTITTAALSTNTVYALCGIARYNENFRELYVDGVSVGTNTASGSLLNSQFTFMGSVYQGGRNRCLRIYAFYCWTRELSATEVRSLTTNPWQIFKKDTKPLFLSSPNVAYSLTADSGGYNLTGSTAELLRSLNLSAASGTYDLTGSDATLSRGFSLSADSGAYSLVGSDATLNRTYSFLADSGAYNLTGIANAFVIARNLVADSGSYLLNGQDATFSTGKTLSADSGSYQISGQAAEFMRTYSFSADAGSFNLTGSAATLTAARLLSADSGSYSITGAPASLIKFSIYPDPGDVREGVSYGPGGIYVGTLKVGGKILFIFDD